MVRYIVLPPSGYYSENLIEWDAEVSPGPGMAVLTPMGAKAFTAGLDADLTVHDRLSDDGPRLVTMSAAKAREVRRDPRVLLAPVRTYRPALRPAVKLRRAQVVPSSPKKRLAVRILDQDGNPIAGVRVHAFSDFVEGIGATSTTGARGTVRFSLYTESTLDALYVEAPLGLWGHFSRNVDVESGAVDVTLGRVDPNATHVLRALYGHPAESVGAGVRVGVIDSGVELNRPDLPLRRSADLTGDGGGPGEAGPHGTHVAGIIGARGTSFHGVAPGVDLFSYRVFGDRGETDNFTIMKAIQMAIDDGCDIINLSLGGAGADPAVDRAVGDAYARGVLCVCAAGNEGRAPVGFPASYKRGLAVSAFGIEGTFPSDSTETVDVARPPVGEPDYFIAAFSNVGHSLDFTGPGVGVVSTVPGPARFGVMSGTSMACPAVTGIAAALLSSSPELLAMPRDHHRTRALMTELAGRAVPSGFGHEFEGMGYFSSHPSGSQ